MEVKSMDLNSLVIGENYRFAAEKDVSELMSSIKEMGQLQPVLVKKKGAKYELLAGHRRFYAIKKLGLKTIKAINMPADTSKRLVNLTENLQREETNCYESGRGIYELMKHDKMSINEVSVKIGISITSIKKLLDIFNDTPAPYRKYIKSAQKGRAAIGFIPSTTAHKIINLQKNKNINAKEARVLLEEVKEGRINSSKLKSVVRNLRNGCTFQNALTDMNKAKTVYLRINLPITKVRSIEKARKDSFENVCKTILEKELKVKYL